MKESIETVAGGCDVRNTGILIAEAWECPFQRLCEELYPEPEMKTYRERCNRDYTSYCSHYWAFHDGYHDLDED